MGQGRHTLRSISDPVYPRPLQDNEHCTGNTVVCLSFCDRTVQRGKALLNISPFPSRQVLEVQSAALAASSS